jgi:hypothetical protein
LSTCQPPRSTGWLTPQTGTTWSGTTSRSPFLSRPRRSGRAPVAAELADLRVKRELSSGGAAGPNHGAHRGRAGHAAQRRSGPRLVRLACPLPSRAASGHGFRGSRPSGGCTRKAEGQNPARVQIKSGRGHRAVEQRPQLQHRPRGQNPQPLPSRLHASRAVRGLGLRPRIPPTAPAYLRLYSHRPRALHCSSTWIAPERKAPASPSSESAWRSSPHDQNGGLPPQICAEGISR